MTAPASLAEALARRATTLLWALDLTLYDAVADSEQTRYLATLDVTLRPSDSIAPGRRYQGRLERPTLSWSLVRGTQVDGDSSADGAQLAWLDLTGRDADIATAQLSVADRPQVLRLGHPQLDSSQWLDLHFNGRKLEATATGWSLDLRSLDFRLDQLLPRRRLLGLGACLAFDGHHHATVAPSGELIPAAPMAVEALLRTTQSAHATVVSRGAVAPGGDWALWVHADGRARWTLRNNTGQAVVVASSDPVNDGKLRRLAGLWDGTTSHLLVDGQVVASLPFAGPPQVTPGQSLTIGDDGTTFRRFVGELDDIRLWTGDVPSLDELAAWARRELPEEQRRRPRAYWRMNEAFGDTAFDDSLHENAAELQGPDVEAMWSSLLEGAPDQRDQLRPLGLGVERRVPGLQVGPRTWQVSDLGCHGIGPVDEGVVFLRPQRRWTAGDVAIVTASGGLSAELPVDWIRTAGQVDFGGLVPRQHLRITTPTQSEVVRVMALSTPEEIAVAGGVLTAEVAGEPVTVETIGFEGTASDVTIDRDAKTITTAGSWQLVGQLAGDTFTLSSPANSGSYTLAEASTTWQLRVVEDLAADEGPGVPITVAFDDPHEYTVDLEAGTITLRGTPSLPLAIAFRGPLDIGRSRADLIRHLVEMGGIPPAEIDLEAFSTFAKEDKGPVGLWLGPEDELTTRQAIDPLTHGASWGTRWTTGSVDLAHRSLDGEPSLELRFPEHFVHLEPAPARPPIQSQQVTYAPNAVDLTPDQVAPLARLQGLGNPDAVAYAERPHLTADAVVDPVLHRRHALAEEPPPVPTRYQLEADATVAAQRLYQLDAPGRQVLRAVLPLGPFLLLDWRRALVRITSPHHAGLETGKVFLPLSVTVDDGAHLLIVFFWG